MSEWKSEWVCEWIKGMRRCSAWASLDVKYKCRVTIRTYSGRRVSYDGSVLVSSHSILSMQYGTVRYSASQGRIGQGGVEIRNSSTLLWYHISHHTTPHHIMTHLTRQSHTTLYHTTLNCTSPKFNKLLSFAYLYRFEFKIQMNELMVIRSRIRISNKQNKTINQTLHLSCIILNIKCSRWMHQWQLEILTSKSITVPIFFLFTVFRDYHVYCDITCVVL